MDRYLVLVLGYLIGAISPAYVLGRLTHNAGVRPGSNGSGDTAAAFRRLGFGPGAVAALFNLSKGLLAMLVARALGVPPVFVLATGAAALVGHLLPFYLRFRGGTGISVASSIAVVNLFLLARDHPLTWQSSAAVGIAAVATLVVTRRLVLVGLTAVPVLGWSLLHEIPASPLLWYTLGLLAFIFVAALLDTLRRRLLAPSERTRRTIRFWRFVLRPAAMAFPVLLHTAGRLFTVILLAVVTAAFVAMDVSRLSARRVNLFLLRSAARTFKQDERHRISSMTGFLLAALLVMLVFDGTVTLYAIAFLVFGDFFAKYCGLQFGRTRLFRKTLEGSIAHLAACLVAGAVVAGYVPLPAWVIVTGAVTATAFEVLPINVDDNLTVGITSAVALHLARLAA